MTLDLLPLHTEDRPERPELRTRDRRAEEAPDRFAHLLDKASPKDPPYAESHAETHAGPLAGPLAEHLPDPVPLAGMLIGHMVLPPPVQTLDVAAPLLAEPALRPPPLPEGIRIRRREAAPQPVMPARTPAAKAPEPAPQAEAAEVGEPGFTPLPLPTEGEELPKSTADSGLMMPKMEVPVHAEKAAEVSEAGPIETPELAAPMPQQLNLEIADSQGRWELDVMRQGDQIHVAIAGDVGLRQVVHEARAELEQRMALHGDSLASIQWRPIAATAQSSNDRLEAGQHQGGHPDGHRQPPPRGDAPTPQPHAPADDEPATSGHRGLIHRIL